MCFVEKIHRQALSQRDTNRWVLSGCSALSTFATPANTNAEPFTSILAIDPTTAGCHPSRVHAVYGASKDWGANGLRIGALVSQANPDLHVAMESSCLLMKISSAAVSGSCSGKNDECASDG